MQDLFVAGILFAVALGVFLYKTFLFVIYLRNSKVDDEIIRKNAALNKLSQQQAQQIQKTMSSIENVVDWKMDDPRLVSEDLRQQFLTKIKTRRTPPIDRASPRERVPLATTDYGDDFENDQEVPIYTYNPHIGGTQV